jgi:hypothetical protein
MPEYTDEQLQAVRDTLPEDLLDAVVAREIRAGARERKSAARERHKLRKSGAALTRSRRPEALLDDRRLAPGVLKHWRRVHGLTQRQAQERIGYSATGHTWARWESGLTCPPFRALLKIIAATGLGFWTDPDNSLGVDGDLRLEMEAARKAAKNGH